MVVVTVDVPLSGHRDGLMDREGWDRIFRRSRNLTCSRARKMMVLGCRTMYDPIDLYS